MPKFLRIISQTSLRGGILGGIFGILNGLGFVLINGMFLQHITSIILLCVYFCLGFFLIGIFAGFFYSILLILFREKQKSVQGWISPIYLLILAAVIFLGSINSRNLIIEFGNMLINLCISIKKIRVCRKEKTDLV
jgi:hypothetical protein